MLPPSTTNSKLANSEKSPLFLNSPQAIHAIEAIPYLAGVGNRGTATAETIQECLEIFKNESRPGLACQKSLQSLHTDGVIHYFKHRYSPEVAQSEGSCAKCN